MKYILIKNLRDSSTEIISVKDLSVPINIVVEAWQKNTWDYHAFKRVVPVAYKWAKSSDFVDALIESANF